MNNEELVANGSGFGINFSNGYRLAVRWGPDCECEHKGTSYEGDYFKAYRTSRDAQIAVLNPKGQPVELEDGYNSVGHVPADFIARFSAVVADALNDNEVTTGYAKLKTKRSIFSTISECWRIPAKAIGA